jgi:hypothetical protein
MRAVTPSRLLRPLLVSALLSAPFVLVALKVGSWVGPITQLSVALLLEVTAPLHAAAASARSEAEAPLDEPVELGRVALEAATKAPRKGVKVPAQAKPASVFVSGATVLRLAQSAARPSGAFVPRTEHHPAGLRLSGVASLGIGLQEGDILIEALGMPPRAPEQIIGAIIEARAKQARFLSGTLWRRGQTVRITVEQPYLPLPA